MDYITPPSSNNLPPKEPFVIGEQAGKVHPKIFNRNFYIALGVLIVLAILGIGGFFYWYSNLQSKKLRNNSVQNLSQQKSTVQNQIAPEQVALAETAQLENLTPPAPQSCGTARDEIGAHILFGIPPSSPITAAETSALKCMDTAIERCQPAYFVTTNDQGAKAKTEVVGSAGGNCVISQQDYKGKEAMCQISIPDLTAQTQSASRGVNVAVGANTFGAGMFIEMEAIGATATNKNGSEVKIDCTVPKPSVKFFVDYGRAIKNQTGSLVTVPQNTNYFYLHWQTDAYAQTCRGSGSWTGAAPTWGAFSFGDPQDSQLFDLKASFAKSGYTPTDPATGEYTFGLTCANKNGGKTSNQIKVYLK